MKIDGYIVTSMRHKRCRPCTESAERAAVLARVTGSIKVRSHEPHHGATVERGKR